MEKENRGIGRKTMATIKRALISCTNKTGLVEFAKFLQSQNVEILSTGGTAKFLKDNNISVKDVSDETSFPEMMDGRLKTLHPKVHGGILAIRDNVEHKKSMEEHAISPIDLVVVNLYDFEKVASDPDCSLENAIENIDIGGPTLIRAAAKNYKFVTVVVDPLDYAKVQDAMINCSLEKHLRYSLAQKAFALTAQYDCTISSYLSHQDTLSFHFQKMENLRYGENPHQKASLYRLPGASGIVDAVQIQGKELSFNNLLDTEAAYRCCRDFSQATCVIVKHGNPCGVASAEKLSEAFLKARTGDPVSSFGGIVAFNKTVGPQTALNIAETFFEVILAPDYHKEALTLFQKKKNLRVLKLADWSCKNNHELRQISGGILWQETDQKLVDLKDCQVMSKQKPSNSEWKSLEFAWRVAKHVKSNAIVFAKDSQTLGIGAGQMSRVDAVKLAAMKAEENFSEKNILKNAAMASDAFFPFRDGIDVAAPWGITVIVQPGGSVRDNEVIEACDEHGIALVLTGVRHFRH